MNLSLLRAALGALLLLAPPQDRSASADPGLETFLTTGFELGERGAVTLRYRTIAWSPDSWRALRREPAQREQSSRRRSRSRSAAAASSRGAGASAY